MVINCPPMSRHENAVVVFDQRVSRRSGHYGKNGRMVSQIERFGDVFAPRVEPGAAVLDLACGMDEITRAFVVCDWRMSGRNFFPAMLDQAAHAATLPVAVTGWVLAFRFLRTKFIGRPATS